MKIGLILYGSIHTLSGGYLYDRSLVKYLRDQGETVDIISIPFRNYYSHLLDNISFKLPSNYDIFIQDELIHASLIGANSQNHSYPVVSLVHHLLASEKSPNWLARIYRFIEGRYLRSVDGFIFNSITTAASVSRLVDLEKPSIVAYPPTDQFGLCITPEEIRTRALNSLLRLAFVGNLIPRKGLHILLDALSAMYQSRQIPIHGNDSQPVQRAPAVTLDIIGSQEVQPGYAGAMKDKVRRHGLDGKVTFHGALDSEPLKEVLKDAHLLVLPSSYEGYGIAYLEGMGFGLPAIGTTNGAAREIITDGMNGYLIEPENSDALLNKLLALAADRELLTYMSLAARQRYLEQPAWTDTAGRIRDFLIKMANKSLRPI